MAEDRNGQDNEIHCRHDGEVMEVRAWNKFSILYECKKCKSLVNVTSLRALSMETQDHERRYCPACGMQMRYMHPSPYPDQTTDRELWRLQECQNVTCLRYDQMIDVLAGVNFGIVNMQAGNDNVLLIAGKAYMTWLQFVREELLHMQGAEKSVEEQAEHAFPEMLCKHCGTVMKRKIDGDTLTFTCPQCLRTQRHHIPHSSEW